MLNYSHLDVDEADWLVGAATFYKDPYFWKSVDGTTSGPLSIIPLSLIPLLGGVLSYVSVRLFALLVYLLPGVLFTYLGLKNVYGRNIATLTVIPLAGVMAVTQNLNAYNGEFPILFLTALSFYLYSITPSRWKAAFYFFAGVVMGLFVYSKPQAIPLGMIIALGFLWKLLNIQAPGKYWLLFIFGGLFPSILVSIYLSANHLWLDFINSYIYNNLFYGGVHGAFGNDYTAGDILSKMLDYLVSQPEYSYWMLTGLVSFLIGFLFVTTSFFQLNDDSGRELLFALFMISFAFFCTVKPLTFFYHYQNILLVPIAWLTGTSFATAHRLFGSLNVESIVFKPLLKNVFIPFFFVFTLLLGSIQAIEHTEPTLFLLGGTEDRRSLEAKMISTYTQPNEKMAIWGWNTPLFIDTQLLQGTRDGHTHYHMHPIKLQDYYLERYVKDLIQNQPTVLVETFIGYSALIFGAEGRKKFGLENYPVVYDYVKTHYDLKEDVNGQTRIFVLKNSTI
ncbi:glycosyltransferase family 39 protein [Arundinibacter roseus]|nr:glycosyltransferase family 39 protein [Arundinibacter roseus]